MEENMISLTSKSAIDCDEAEWETHTQELLGIEEKLGELPDYDCAVIMQYQDPDNSAPAKIDRCTLHEAFDVLQWGDLKNGADAFLDDDGNLVLVSYGQMYSVNGKTYLVTRGYKILPYNEKREFLNISGALTGEKEVMVAEQQF